MAGERSGYADELLTLQEAADRLKVHYMTAYRWVRRGELPAIKAGGRLRVRVGDLGSFLRAREVEVALPGPSAGRTDWGLHLGRLHRLLLAGDAVEAGSLVRRVIADGATGGEVYLQLIAPALQMLGEDWACGSISVAEEHRGTEIAAGIMARMAELFRRRGRSRGIAVTLTPPGEQHGLAAAMAADFLRGAGYDVHHLGPEVPPEDLARFLELVPADVVCLSVSRSPDDRVIAEVIAAARGGEHGSRLVVVGGRGAESKVVEAAGGVLVDDLGRLLARLDEVSG